jgi:chromosome segregation ATPase
MFQKLQAAATKQSLEQEKLSNSASFEGGQMQGLRDELCSVLEKSRISDRKQLNLQHTLTGLKEELSIKSTHIMELEEQLSDKTAQCSTFEQKLVSRNNRVLEMQQEFERTIEKYEIMVSESQKLKAKNALQKQKLESNDQTIKMNLIELKKLKETGSNLQEKCAHLEITNQEVTRALKNSQQKSETKAALHSEQVQELRSTINVLKEQSEATNAVIISLESSVSELQELSKHKDKLISDLQESLSLSQTECDF